MQPRVKRTLGGRSQAGCIGVTNIVTRRSLSQARRAPRREGRRMAGVEPPRVELHL